MTKKISDLPKELTEEVLSRLPITSLRTVRSTCKIWNNLSKDRILIKKEKNECQVVIMMGFRVYMMSINLHSTHIKKRYIGKFNIGVKISRIFHCDGLLVCRTQDLFNLVVWNPYLSQTRWIKPRNIYNEFDSYALGYGYEKNKKNYKIFRFFDNYRLRNTQCEIFSFDSNSWKTFDGVTPKQSLLFHIHCVSLDGNIYWLAKDKRKSIIGDALPSFHLISFDFTTEKFGPKLPLPFHAVDKDRVILSSVKEKQLAVLVQKYDDEHASMVKIWITSKIEPNSVSWRSKVFLEFDISPHVTNYFESFFVDEEKQIAGLTCKSCNIVFIIGNNGYFKAMKLGKTKPKYIDKNLFMCDYVPSLLEI